MKIKYFTLIGILFPLVTQAGIIPEGKTFEFFGILTFIILIAILFLIYYFNWKSGKGRVKSDYVIKTTQYMKNGRMYVRSQKIKISGAGESSLHTGEA